MLHRLAPALLTLFAVAACGGDDESPGKKPSSGGAGGSVGSGGSSASGGSAGSGSSGGAADAGVGGGAGTLGTGGALGCTLAPVAPGTTEHAVTSSGAQRKARVHVPASYDAKKKVPLVLMFHGYLESPQQFEDISQMTPVSDAQGFVVAYAEGVSQGWNAGKCCGTAASQKTPDVQFVSDLIDALSLELCIDDKRVYAAGFSNGGMLSNRLACELSDRIAAFAPVAGPLAVDGCKPTRFMPMIEFHGTGDFVVPYAGGGLGGAISVAANVAFWSQNAGCVDPKPAEVYKNGDTTCVESSECQGGAAVRLCTVEGGGHQWPGGNSAGPGGKVTKDIKASEEMLKFFLAHPLQ